MNACENCRHEDLYSTDSPCDICSKYCNWEGNAEAMDARVAELLGELYAVEAERDAYRASLDRVAEDNDDWT